MKINKIKMNRIKKGASLGLKDMTICKKIRKFFNKKANKEESLGRYVKRIPFRIREYDWHITIDDGFVAYRYPLNASRNYSIEDLYRKIRKSVKRKL